MNNNEPWQNLMDSVEKALAYMYKHRLNTDVTFVTKNKESSMCSCCFSAHKLILATVSPVFADLLREERHGRSTIRNEDISTRGFDILLWYVYTGILDFQYLHELIDAAEAARSYEINCLLRACERQVQGCPVNAENVFSVLEVASYFKVDVKRNECLDFIRDESENILHTPQFLNADLARVKEILKLPCLSLGAKELSEISINWIQHNKTSDRSLLACLDFSTMSCNDFLEIEKIFPDFFQPEEIASILANFVNPGIEEYPSWFTVYNRDSNITEGQNSSSSVPCLDLACNLIKRTSFEVKTDCYQRLWNASLFERDGFNGSMAFQIKITNAVPGKTSLVMFEFSFGVAFVPENSLNLDIYFLGHNLTHRKKKVKHCLISTPQHFYAVLGHKKRLKTNQSFVFMVEINVSGLCQWGTNAPVSNEQYRPVMIPKRTSYDVCSNSLVKQSVSLVPLTDWIALVEPKSGQKKFLVSSLFLDTDFNHGRVIKTLGL